MPEQLDVIVVGGGAAGISSALTLRNRGKRCLVISVDSAGSGLYKAERIDNYPGLPGLSGARIHDAMRGHADDLGIQFSNARVISASASPEGFFVSAGSDFYECGALILATGITQKSVFPGEDQLLGAGVSYCATCDGMLYRGKKVAVVGLSGDAVHEANFLKSLNSEVLFFSDGRETKELHPDISAVKAKKYEIKGSDKVKAITADGVDYPCDGVFILRNTIAMSALMPDLELEKGHIKVDRGMRTSVPGVFAAGDCTGLPYQLPKAVGEGNMAAISAAEYLDRKRKDQS